MKVQTQDIILITDNKHKWCGCILIVDEVKTWGVQAYIPIPQESFQPTPIGLMCIRLKNATFAIVGSIG